MRICEGAEKKLTKNLARSKFEKFRSDWGKEKMDDSELFDVFTVDNNPEPEQKTIARPERPKSKKEKKEKKEKSKSKSKDGSANGVNGKRSHEEHSAKSDDEEDVDGVIDLPPSTKRFRKNNDNPIVVDSFETESDQIVRATTGLQGVAPTDENIVIKKKVN